MLLELIAAFVAGFAGAGIVMALRALSRGRLPRWLIPVGAGAGMLAMAIYNEYGWYGRNAAALPEGVEIALTVEERAAWRPWTFVVPMTTRFLAVDGRTLRTNAALPGQRLAEVLAFGRWQPVRQLTVVVDCEAGRRADIVEGVSLGEDGALQGAQWRDVGREDPIVATACGMEAP